MNIKKMWLGLCLLLTVTSFISMTEKKHPVIFMIGDSTMANKDLRGGNTERGWGAMLPGFLPEEVRVENHAQNGRSSRSFRGEGLWGKVYDKITPGDYVFIQFGHNDQKKDTARFSDPNSDFRKNLERYVKETRKKGGIPVLFTSIARRNFQDTVLVDTHGDYIKAVVEVGKKTKTPVIDMNKRSIEFFTKAGVEGTKMLFNHVLPKTQAFRPEGKVDDTHFSITGARELAKIAIEEISPVFPELASYFITNDFVVAQDGSGQFFTVQEAINAVPDYRKNTTTIYVKNGTYNEKIVVPESKSNIRMIGENVEKTILTYSDHANTLNTFGETKGTSGSSSCYVYGPSFEANNITFQNTAGPVGQAVAILVKGDRAIFRNCRFLGFQDTLYAYGNREGLARQYYENCYIEGTVDFIFGWATAWFENCVIYAKKDGYYTAASTPEGQQFGYVFNNCKITGDKDVKMYLGRPWRLYAQTVFMNSQLDSNVRAEGWHDWKKQEAHTTAFYAEYNNTGEGADASKRVYWSKQLSKDEADKITIESVLGGSDNWNPVLE